MTDHPAKNSTHDTIATVAIIVVAAAFVWSMYDMRKRGIAMDDEIRLALAKIPVIPDGGA